jgi:hypothetical protein
MAVSEETRLFLAWLRSHARDGFLYVLSREAESGTVKQAFAGGEHAVLTVEKTVQRRAADSHVWVGLTTYAKRKAVKANAYHSRLVWIDHDGPDAQPLTWDPPPHVCVQTSEGHAQGIWLLDKALPQEETEELNTALAKHFGADLSDKDVTQVHRVPGTVNYKHDPPQDVRLLWLRTEQEQPAYTAQALRVALPVSPVSPEPTPDTGPAPESGTRERALYTLGHLDVPIDLVRETFLDKQEDRSAALYKLMAAAFERGGTTPEVYSIATHSANQKFDTAERLWEDVQRTRVKVPATEARWELHLASELEEVSDKTDWLVRPFLYADAVGTIVGEPSARKSWNALHLSTAIACPQADAFLVFPILVHGPVLYFNLDDQRARRLKKRLGNILAHYRDGDRTFDVPLWWANRGFDYRTKGWQLRLRQNMEQIGEREGRRPVLVVFDTLHRAGFDPKDWGANAQTFLNGLNEIAVDLTVSFMLVHHTSKAAQQANIRNAPWGSTFTGASLDPAWLLTQNKKEDAEDKTRSHVDLQIETKESGETVDPILLAYGRDSDVFDVEVRQADLDTKVMVELRRAPDALNVSELARRLNIEHVETLRRAVERLELAGSLATKRQGSAKMVYLPEGPTHEF